MSIPAPELLAGHPLVPAAYGEAFAPAGKRRRWVTAVQCCHCPGVHLHRGFEDAPAQGVRRSGCGLRYWVVVGATVRDREVVA